MDLVKSGFGNVAKHENSKRSNLRWIWKRFYFLAKEAHIRRNELLTVFQSGFRRDHSTMAAV
jgi:hypothetical protein